MVSPLRLGLHSDLEQLKAAVYDNIRSLAAFSDGILIFYGKCGNALADLEHDLSDLACPLYFLTDERGERIDDCIALALGGNKNYDRTLAEHQDVALFMTPMWASHWRAMGQEDAASGKRLDLGAMLKGTVMTKVARIDTGLCFEPGFIEKVDGFAREFGLQRIELPGGTTVAEGCYERAKSSLAGRPTGARPAHGSVLQEFGLGVVGHGLINLEETEGSRAFGMHDPLRNPLPIEVGYFLDEQEILQKSRTALPNGLRVLVITDGIPFVGGHASRICIGFVFILCT